LLPNALKTATSGKLIFHDYVMAQERIWTILDLIKWGTNYLGEKGFDEARLNIELLLSAALNLKRFDLYVKHDQPLGKDELAKFKTLLKRRLSHEPIQYILGKTNFYSIELKIDKRALIPRPETEMLVEAVIDHCKTHFHQNSEFNILEVGTGSGCIAIALAKFLKNARITSLDKSREALDLACENANLTNTMEQIEFVEADFLSLSDNIFGKNFEIIVSNPPYVSESAFKTLDEDVRKFEPVSALSDGADGLTFFRQISRSSSFLLNQGGWVFVETSFDQADEVKKIFLESGGAELQIRKDLSNIDRIVCARF
jgi:release factor glutamine methyltransferase